MFVAADRRSPARAQRTPGAVVRILSPEDWNSPQPQPAGKRETTRGHKPAARRAARRGLWAEPSTSGAEPGAGSAWRPELSQGASRGVHSGRCRHPAGEREERDREARPLAGRASVGQCVREGAGGRVSATQSAAAAAAKRTCWSPAPPPPPPPSPPPAHGTEPGPAASACARPAQPRRLGRSPFLLGLRRSSPPVLLPPLHAQGPCRLPALLSRGTRSM